ncbi:hypothetical protein F5B22DRAFT_627124 [Xylaria bambusicola]|uniref:uncharacterized protein n=1 Tax=Xylaria bambusicola TaxID=326684 RepID=UPI0020074766|nr:uncharacterized protein F5B22DRAFT_627124 [Xylaria bambusicola]KAI0505612.1 hypothetical protein F5B22DRAFT_627124 [Xylaria bambusicola]
MTPPVLPWCIIAYQWAIHFRLVNASLQCYYPNGEKADGDSPCNPDADASFCCGSSSDNSCLNNLLCQDGIGRVIRGSCTDQSWTDPACPKYCLSFNTGGEDLIPCNNVTNDHISYCCNGAIADCCDSGDGRFDVFPYPTLIIASWNSASKEFQVLPGAFSTSSSSPSIMPTSTSSLTTTVAFSTTSSAPMNTVTSPSTIPDHTKNDSELSQGAKIGIGVGVGGGVLLAALLAYLIWRTHKTHSAVKQQQNLNLHSHPPSTMMMDNGLPQSYAPSYYQYKSPSFSPATPAQLVADSEISSEIRTYELPTHSS